LEKLDTRMFEVAMTPASGEKAEFVSMAVGSPVKNQWLAPRNQLDWCTSTSRIQFSRVRSVFRAGKREAVEQLTRNRHERMTNPRDKHRFMAILLSCCHLADERVY
jgi:hypothetical protein